MTLRLGTMETQSGGSTQGNQRVVMNLEANMYCHGFLVGRGKASRIKRVGCYYIFRKSCRFPPDTRILRWNSACLPKSACRPIECRYTSIQ